jgi:hypothetical protein
VLEGKDVEHDVWLKAAFFAINEEDYKLDYVPPALHLAITVAY